MVEWESLPLDEDEGAGVYRYLLYAARGDTILAKRTITWRKFEHSDCYIITGVEMALRYMIRQVENA